ncbi:MAG: hypothetical protein HY940_10065 [Gammaproteobacteria bacterium]|nr:hypothetical protein [Gammaproteobacteria bacterium]
MKWIGGGLTGGRVAVLAVLLGGIAPVGAEPNIGIFGDVGWADRSALGKASQFGLGALSVYVHDQMDDRTEGFFEYVLEGDGAALNGDLERLYIKRSVGKDLRFGIGRFHSPIGFWNNHYHHGVLMQDTVSRPAFLEFEDNATAVLPTHAIGASLEGEAGAVGYELSLANTVFIDTAAPIAERTLGVGNFFDMADDKALYARVSHEYDDSGAHIGVSYLYNPIVEGAVLGGVDGGSKGQGQLLVEQTVIGVDGRYEHQGFSLMGEYFQISNDAEAGVGDGGSHRSTAYYLQAGYRVAERLLPTYRFESLVFDAQDGFYTMLGREEYTAHVMALRYEFDDSNAMILEYRASDGIAPAANPAQGDSIKLNWSFLLL